MSLYEIASTPEAPVPRFLQCIQYVPFTSGDMAGNVTVPGVSPVIATGFDTQKIWNPQALTAEITGCRYALRRAFIEGALRGDSCSPRQR